MQADLINVTLEMSKLSLSRRTFNQEYITFMQHCVMFVETLNEDVGVLYLSFFIKNVSNVEPCVFLIINQSLVCFVGCQSLCI